jgi:HK97 gp10 family phage protein
VAEYFRVEGLASLEGKLKRLREEYGVKTGGVIIRGLKAGAVLIRNDAKKRAPSSDPSGLTKARVNALLGGNFQYGKRGKKLNKSRAALKAANQRGEILKKQLALIRQNIVSYPVKADIPTVVVRVRNRGWVRGANSVRAALSGKQSIRFKNPGVSPGYWWWIEFGTSRLKGKPYLRPAFIAKKKDAIEAMRDAIKKEIAKNYPLVSGPVRR